MKSLYYAAAGLKHAFAKQPNFRRELAIAAGVGLVGGLIGLSGWEWAIVILTIFLVLMAELANTALEAAVNAAVAEFCPQAKIAKDVAAGMVLLAAINSIVIGVLLFVPKLLLYLK